MKYNNTKFEWETPQWAPGMNRTGGGSKSQNPSKIAKGKTNFGTICVFVVFVEGAICIRTNLDD